MHIHRRLAHMGEARNLVPDVLIRLLALAQRKIPFENGDTFGHWRQCLPEYEKEFACFKAHLEEMKNGIFPSMVYL